MPRPEVEHRAAALAAHAQAAEGRTGISRRERGGCLGCRRDHQPLTPFGTASLALQGADPRLVDRFRAAIEQHLEQAAAEQAGEKAAGIGVGQHHRADAVLGQEQHDALVAEHAAAMADHRRAIPRAHYQTHAIGCVLASRDLRLAALQQIRLRDKAGPVRQQAARQLQLEIARQVAGAGPHAAGRPHRHDRVVHVHARQGRRAGDVVLVRVRRGIVREGLWMAKSKVVRVMPSGSKIRCRIAAS